MADEKVKATIYEIGGIPASALTSLQLSPPYVSVFQTTNPAKLNSAGDVMPFDFISGDVVVAVEELQQTIEGNLDEKVRSLLKNWANTPFWERRLNTLYAKGYITEAGYKSAKGLFIDEQQRLRRPLRQNEFADITNSILIFDEIFYDSASQERFRDGMLNAKIMYMADDSQLTLHYGEGHPQQGQAITFNEIYKAAYEHDININGVTLALLSVVNDKLAARAIENNGRKNQLQTQRFDMGILTRELAHLFETNPEYANAIGPDGADFYAVQGFHSFIADLVLILDTMKANATATSESIVSLMVENPDGSLQEWVDENNETQTVLRVRATQEYGLRDASELLSPNFVCRYPEDALTHDGKPLAELVNPPVPRRKILETFTQNRDSGMPVNHAELYVAVILPQAAMGSNDYKAAVTVALEEKGHIPVFYTYEDLESKPHLYDKLFDKHGLYVLLQPECVGKLLRGDKLRAAQLKYNIITANLMDTMVTTPRGRGDRVVHIGPEQARGKVLDTENLLDVPATLGTAAHHKNETNFFIHNKPKYVTIQLREAITKITAKSRVRLQATGLDNPALLSANPNLHEAPDITTDKERGYGVLQVTMIGSASNQNLEALNLSEAVLNAVYNYANTQQIIIDGRHGEGARSQMGLFAHRVQTLPVAKIGDADNKEQELSLVIATRGATTHPLSKLEGGEGARSPHTILTHNIVARKKQIFEDTYGLEKSPGVIVCGLGGIGTLNEVYEAFKRHCETGQPSLMVIASKDKLYCQEVESLCKKFKMPAFIPQLPDTLDLSDTRNISVLQAHLLPQITDALDGFLAAHEQSLKYLSVPEIMNRLPANLVASDDAAAMLSTVYNQPTTPLMVNRAAWPVHLQEAFDARNNLIKYETTAALFAGR